MYKKISFILLISIFAAVAKAEDSSYEIKTPCKFIKEMATASVSGSYPAPPAVSHFDGSGATESCSDLKDNSTAYAKLYMRALVIAENNHEYEFRISSLEGSTPEDRLRLKQVIHDYILNQQSPDLEREFSQKILPQVEKAVVAKERGHQAEASELLKQAHAKWQEFLLSLK